eukprot:2382855-Amphidinium_carterae.1
MTWITRIQQHRVGTTETVMAVYRETTPTTYSAHEHLKSRILGTGQSWLYDHMQCLKNFFAADSMKD